MAYLTTTCVIARRVTYEDTRRETVLLTEMFDSCHPRDSILTTLPRERHRIAVPDLSISVTLLERRTI